MQVIIAHQPTDYEYMLQKGVRVLKQRDEVREMEGQRLANMYDMPTRNDDMPTRNDDMPTRTYDMPTRGDDLPTRTYDMPTRGDDMPT